MGLAKKEEDKSASKRSGLPNKRERRQVRKLQEEACRLEQEKTVAQAAEDLKQATMLSRKRKPARLRMLSNLRHWKRNRWSKEKLSPKQKKI